MPVPNIVIDRCRLLISWYMCMDAIINVTMLEKYRLPMINDIFLKKKLYLVYVVQTCFLIVLYILNIFMTENALVKKTTLL